MWIAAASGNTAELRRLIRSGRDCDAPNYAGHTPAHIAAINGRPASLRLLIEARADVRAVDRYGCSPALAATCSNSVDCLELLLSAGVKVDGVDGRSPGWGTLLSTATHNGAEACLARLIELGANVDARRECDDARPLWNAAKRGHGGCVALLLGAGAERDARCAKLSSTPVWAAVRWNRPDCLRRLLEAGADPDVRAGDELSSTPAWIAAKWGHARCLSLLLHHGADLHLRDRVGRDPAYVAAQTGRVECLALLHKSGADLSRANADGRTPVWIAAWRGRERCLRFLLGTGADADSPNSDRQSAHWSPNCSNCRPIWAALWRGHTGCVRALLETGRVDLNERWDPDAESAPGYTLLHVAALKYSVYREGSMACLELLIAAGADLNAAAADGLRPIHVAIDRCGDRCDISLLRRLIVAGCDVRARDGEGQTSLHRIFFTCSPAHIGRRSARELACQRLLVAAGLGVNLLEPSGMTAAFYAVSSDLARCLSMLLRAGASRYHVIGDGVTLRHLAVARGAVHCLELLRDDRFGRATPPSVYASLLFTAIASHCIGSVRWVIRQRSDVIYRSTEWYVPRVHCRHYNYKWSDILKQLSRVRLEGAIPALCFAAEQCFAEALRLLIAMGVDVNATDWRGRTALHAAAAQRNRGRPFPIPWRDGNPLLCLKLLVAAGADPNHPGGDGRTPLFVAAKSNSLGQLLMLLHVGAAVNLVSCDARSALDVAVASGHAAIVAALLSNGARPCCCTRATREALCGFVAPPPSKQEQRRRALAEMNMLPSHRLYVDNKPDYHPPENEAKVMPMKDYQCIIALLAASAAAALPAEASTLICEFVTVGCRMGVGWYRFWSSRPTYQRSRYYENQYYTGLGWRGYEGLDYRMFSRRDRAAIVTVLGAAQREPLHLPSDVCLRICSFVSFRCRIGIGWFEDVVGLVAAYRPTPRHGSRYITWRMKDVPDFFVG